MTDMLMHFGYALLAHALLKLLIAAAEVGWKLFRGH